MALILLTDDRAVVADVCDRVLVMYAGQVVETGSVEDIFYRPQHPYTQGLLDSVPRMDRPADDELHSIPGNPPNMMDLGSGCHFRDRCSKAMDVCKDDPPLQVAQDGRLSRCFIAIENAGMDNSERVASGTDSAEASPETAE